MVGHEQHRPVADHPGETIAFGGVEGRAAVLVVIRDLSHHPDLGLADLLDARVFETRQRARIGHVGMKHGFGLRPRLVYRCVDTVAGAFHLAGAALALAVVDADLHEGRGRHFRPMHPEWNLIVAVAAARHDQGQVVEDPLAETLHEG